MTITLFSPRPNWIKQDLNVSNQTKLDQGGSNQLYKFGFFEGIFGDFQKSQKITRLSNKHSMTRKNMIIIASIMQFVRSIFTLI